MSFFTMRCVNAILVSPKNGVHSHFRHLFRSRTFPTIRSNFTFVTLYDATSCVNSSTRTPFVTNSLNKNIRPISVRRFTSLWGFENTSLSVSPIHKQKRNLSSKIGDDSVDDEIKVSLGEKGNVKQIGKFQPKMVIQYTCKVCGERNSQTFSKQACEKGAVIVTCTECKNRHLIADNLGWFEHVEHKTVEEILAAHDESTRRAVAEYTPDIPWDLGDLGGD